MVIQYSLIIPVYNKSEHLSLFLSQLEKISYDSIEVIFINDGSTDDSWDILKNWNLQKKIPVKIIHQENAGPGMARNAGMKNAIGEYIWFIDSDDIFNPSAFTVFDKFIQQEQSPDIIVFDFERIHKYHITFNSNENLKAMMLSNKESLLFESVTPWSKIFRLKFLRDNDIVFPPYFFAEDLYFTRSAYCNAKKIVKINFVAYKYVVNANSISNTHYKKHSDEFIEICRLIFMLAQKNQAYREELYYNICEHTRNFISNCHEPELYADKFQKLRIFILDNFINLNTYEILETSIQKKYTESVRWKITKPFVQIKKMLDKINEITNYRNNRNQK